MSKPGYFGQYGGQFVPETLMAPLLALAEAYQYYTSHAEFNAELNSYLQHYVGRPTPLSYANRLTQYLGGARIYLKREDLAHTGAHKINNAIGQVLLAKYMKKSRVIAETGAGQHGVATATACALLGLDCTVYMGAIDMQRQAHNVARMQLLGATIVPVNTGTRTLKDAVSEALRDWGTHPDVYYVLGSALGPHPYPSMVRDFQRVIGMEAKQQILAYENRLPDEMVACVGGGSNAIGFFYPFINENSVRLTGVEAGGSGGLQLNQHAARFATGSPGVFQGTRTQLLQDNDGQIGATNSIAAGLDYPGVGPEHAFLHDQGRIHFTHTSDDEVAQAARLLAKLEGIIPALESAHAVAYAIKCAGQLSASNLMIINISGRGDKDVDVLSQMS